MVKVFKSLLESVVVLIGISIVLWLLNKIEVDARGLIMLLANLNITVLLLWIFDLEIFNIAFCILIIILVIYILVKTVLKK